MLSGLERKSVSLGERKGWVGVREGEGKTRNRFTYDLENVGREQSIKHLGYAFSSPKEKGVTALG